MYVGASGGEGPSRPKSARGIAGSAGPVESEPDQALCSAELPAALPPVFVFDRPASCPHRLRTLPAA
jgi:hypothetical protein